MITIIGSLNYDLVTYTNKIPEGGETVTASSFENHLGGKGLNEAIAVARLSPDAGTVPVRMIGRIGNDSFGKDMKRALQEASVDVSYVETVEGISSGVAVILVEQTSGENRILITGGANLKLTPSDSDYEKYFPENSLGFVLLQNEYPDTCKSISWLQKNRPNVNIAYNPSPYKPEYTANGIFAKVDLLIVNEGEALDVSKSLLGDKDISVFQQDVANDKVAAFKLLANKLCKLINDTNINLVVITMGSKGCVYCSKESPASFEPSIKVKSVIDTTGAGDTFFGALVVNLAYGKTVKEAIRFAIKASSLVIQSKGAVESIPLYKNVV